MTTVSTVSSSPSGVTADGSKSSGSTTGAATPSQSGDPFAAILLAMQQGIVAGQPLQTKTAQGQGPTKKPTGAQTIQAAASSLYATGKTSGSSRPLAQKPTQPGSGFVSAKTTAADTKRNTDLASGTTGHQVQQLKGLLKLPTTGATKISTQPQPSVKVSLAGNPSASDPSLQDTSAPGSQRTTLLDSVTSSGLENHGPADNAGKTMQNGLASGPGQNDNAGNATQSNLNLGLVTGQANHANVVTPQTGQVQSTAQTPTVTYGDLQSLYGVAHAAISTSAAGQHTVTVQVHPAGMGTILVSVQQTQNGVQVGLQANQMQVSQWLSQNSEALQSRLNQSGVAVSQVAVTFGDASLQNQQQGTPDRRQRTPDVTLKATKVRTSIGGLEDIGLPGAKSLQMGWQGALQGGWV